MKTRILYEFGDVSRLRVETVPTPHSKAGELALSAAYAGIALINVLLRRGASGFIKLSITSDIVQ